MDVFGIVKQYLEQNGYDGLYCRGECGCLLEDLMPCTSESALRCEPGYKREPDQELDDPNFDCYVGPKEEKEVRVSGVPYKVDLWDLP